MAYVPPTAADLKQRFPEFTAVSDTLVNLILAEASAQVGETWVERDRKPATLYLAAHLLAMEGEPGRSAGSTSGGVTGPVKRRKVGDVETEFAGFGRTDTNGRTDTGYEMTTYGRQFLRLLRLNFPAVVVV